MATHYLFETPPFENDDGVPFVCKAGIDGYGRLSILIMPSNHKGIEGLRKYALMLCGNRAASMSVEEIDEEVEYMAPVYGYLTSNVQTGLGCGEFAVNTYKVIDIYLILTRLGIIEATERTVSQGFYENLPICVMKKVCPATDISVEVPNCDTCRRKPGSQKCSQCLNACYCSRECQTAAWKSYHKSICPLMKQYIASKE